MSGYAEIEHLGKVGTEKKYVRSILQYVRIVAKHIINILFLFYYFFNWDHLKHTLVQLSSLTYCGHLSKSSQIDLPHSLVISWIYTYLSKHCPIYPIAYLLACR